jgi:hypothetical protein
MNMSTPETNKNPKPGQNAGPANAPSTAVTPSSANADARKAASDRAKAVALGVKEGGMIGGGGRFKKIETDRFMFNANALREAGFVIDFDKDQQKWASGSQELVGYLINLIAMAPINNREWNAFVVKTTEPTRALDREKKVVEVPPGAEILIPATHQLVQFFDRVASNPTYVYEVMIKPKKKIKIGGGQTMWTFELGANPANPIARAELGPAALLGYVDNSKVNALPAQGQTSETVGERGSDDVPF